jgi:nitrile hydratase subunit beta
MNGAHDMGGTMGFGPVVPEPNEPVFHGRWEERVLAMTVAMGPVGGWNIDMSRFARENVPPQTYLSRSYYEIWLAGLTRLLDQRGLVTADELARGHMVHPPKPVQRVLKADAVGQFIAAGRSAERDVTQPARFKVGDRVRAKNIHPTGHTRLPRYTRGHVGTVTMLHGGHVYPDTNARGDGEDPQWLYTVSFAARDLWGDNADPTVTVSVDAWDSYLEPAS